jgi:hypothetical protein
MALTERCHINSVTDKQDQRQTGACLIFKLYFDKCTSNKTDQLKIIDFNQTYILQNGTKCIFIKSANQISVLIFVSVCLC